MSATSISAMDFRKKPGTVLDRVYYNRESFIVKRANEPRAVLIPVSEYDNFQRIKNEAKKEFFKMTERIRRSLENEDPRKIQKAIDEAIRKTRSENSSRNN